MAGRKRYVKGPVLWPAQPILCSAGRWDLSQGEHPEHIPNDYLFNIPITLTPEQYNVCHDLSVPVGFSTNGHHIMRDNTFAHAIGDDAWVPIAPQFVRDLSGRVIYSGVGPHAKWEEEWLQDKRVTFPRNCADVTAQSLGAEHIENVFFVSWRCIDVAAETDYVPAYAPGRHIGVGVPNPHMYPYKQRLDTFYQDGWRLPQLEAVYARPSSSQTMRLSEEFMQRWEDRPLNQTYEDFFTANDGEAWYEELFLGGCTVIPTFEAANGYNKVGADFSLVDFWPGRAVEGLHNIVARKIHAAPKGTIIEVIQPGYVTAQVIKLADVVVSDGSGYVSPHAANPAPQYPDFKLPHQRTQARWGATWLPTHPLHFEEPALWGWDDLTGYFLQKSGPLWDPLHYYYASTPRIAKAYRKHEDAGASPYVPVPESFKLRFYPIVELPYADVYSSAALKQREESNISPVSHLDRVKLAEPVPVGYHPLPLACEYELDNFWFPALDPRYRLQHSCPDDVRMRLASVIGPSLSRDEFIVLCHSYGKSMPCWWRAEAPASVQKDITHTNVLTHYPELARYLAPIHPEDVVNLIPLYLEYADDADLSRNVKRVIGTDDQRALLKGISAGLEEAYIAFKSECLSLRRLRHRLLSKYLGVYIYGFWQNMDPADLLAQSRKEPNFWINHARHVLKGKAHVDKKSHPREKGQKAKA